MLLLAIVILSFCALCVHARPVSVLRATENDIVLPPLEPEGSDGAVVVILGRQDVDAQSYTKFASTLQLTLQDALRTCIIITASTNLNTTISNAKSTYNLTTVFVLGHSMSPGGIQAQQLCAAQTTQVDALVLVAAFLQRTYRPDVVDCMKKSSIQPAVSFSHPLGYLEDGVHTCFGPNTVDFPVPVLTIAGELDGVVRVTRVAEAYYTQYKLSNRTQDMFAVIAGMNHASLLNTSTLPSAVTSKDLPAERSADDLLADVCKTIAAFLTNQFLPSKRATQLASAINMDAEDFFAPLIDAFVGQEGNWFFTGADEEHGSSAWAAQAQLHMAEPLPQGSPPFEWSSLANEFRLLSDETKIPPYYRPQHRAKVNVSDSNTLSGSTIAQLRFVTLTPAQTEFGLNGWAIIKEEKTNVLHEVSDIGADFVSAIDISTKLESRQHVFNLTNTSAPDSLDNGNRCANINQLAYEWALNHSAPATVNRFRANGIPLVMGDDMKPTPPAGPWWIWNYLQYNTKTTNGTFVLVQSYYAFYSMSANPYGAGNHYCKLLSPARAMEWIYVDGLRH